MATVIDALVVQLGIDPSQFTKGQKDAAAALVKTRESATKEGKQIEKSIDNAGEAVERLARNALKLFAIFTAGRAIKDFVSDITNADSSLGRLAKSIGSTPEAISALGNAVARNGGSADAAAGSFQRLSDSINEMKTTGNSSALPAFARLQGLSGKQIRLNTDLLTTFGDLADAAKGTADRSGVPMATYLLKQAGVDQDTAALLIQGRAKLMESLRKSGQLGLVRQEDAEAAQRLQTSIRTLQQVSESFGRSIMTAVTPAIVDLIERFQRWLDLNKDWIQSDLVDSLKSFAKQLRELPWEETGKSIKAFAKGADAAAQSMGGWMRVCEALFLFWAGSKAASIVASILRVSGLLSGGPLGAVLKLALAASVASDLAVPNEVKPGVITRSDDENTGAAVPPSGGTRDPRIDRDRAAARDWADRQWRRVKRWTGYGDDEDRGGAGIRTRARRGQEAGLRGGEEGYTGNDGRRSRGATSAEGRANVASWLEFLQKPVADGGLGMSKGKAQASVAMMQGESGGNLDPGAIGDSGHAHGTAQWSDQNGNPRFPLLKRYAASQKKDWRDRTVQQEYFRMEMLGLPGAISHNRAYRAMMAAPTDEQALREGIAKFENPREHALAFQIRKPFLDRLRRADEGDTLPNGTPRVLKPDSMPDAPGQTMREAERARAARSGVGRRPDVLADPGDERRKPLASVLYPTVPKAAQTGAASVVAQTASIAPDRAAVTTNDNRSTSTSTQEAHFHGDMVFNGVRDSGDVERNLRARLKEPQFIQAANYAQA